VSRNLTIDTNSKLLKFRRQPIEQDWPTDDLEYLGACPVCGSRKRQVAYEGLRDKTFFCARGTWTSWRCDSCAVVYLDPRPTQTSIGDAYNSYYTHQTPAQTFSGRILYALQIGIRHSYLNKKKGYKLKGSLPFGWIAYLFLPSQILVTRNTIRDLPSPTQNGARLLDVGCGAGEFLSIARSIGYEAEGLEIDPVARDLAAKGGIKVHLGTLPGSGLPSNYFDHITLSHVLEHFHDPCLALEEIFSLLKSNGRIWVQIPNIDALSLHRFGSNSRLLEPPRHLVLFGTKSLKRALEKAGFQHVELLAPASIKDHDYVFDQSWMIEQGLDPSLTPATLIPAEIKSTSTEMYQRHDSKYENAEIITMIGIKR
jgi:2-polyprenyl-3-methyl-5-hydroxy-6-metoxy-1,4-benzoquinol methylase